MKPLKFIHCADLHLGTPFKGISELNPDLGDLLYQSTYLSFDNIVNLAMKETVDCVLIAGDVYDSEDKSLQAQLRFRNGLIRLSDAGIRTLIAYGNHDPLTGWSATLKWPEAVFSFPGDKVECIPLQDHDETIATVYGISFAKRDIKENLSLRFAPTEEHIPRIGLLHANVGTNTGHESYAPCSIEDLTSISIDYWALGHVHQGGILRSSRPAIVYPGCSQSRSPREIGLKGCYLVTLEFGVDPVIKFVPTDVVRYASDSIYISACLSLDEVQDSVAKKCMGMSDESDGRSLILRLSLTGRTTLHSQLQRTNSISDLLGGIREQLADREPWVWLDRLDLNTAGTYDLDSLRQGNDFIADIVSVFDGLSDPDSQDWTELGGVFQTLFAKWQGHSYLEKFSQEDLQALANGAKGQILDMLLKDT
ncbi:MAG: DNA repair exonuclease [Dehalococcoidales bacterium]|nr:DNA repair exonuclease [Dehalococcoidales bacterium]